MGSALNFLLITHTHTHTQIILYLISSLFLHLFLCRVDDEAVVDRGASYVKHCDKEAVESMTSTHAHERTYTLICCLTVCNLQLFPCFSFQSTFSVMFTVDVVMTRTLGLERIRSNKDKRYVDVRHQRHVKTFIIIIIHSAQQMYYVSVTFGMFVVFQEKIQLVFVEAIYRKSVNHSTHI